MTDRLARIPVTSNLEFEINPNLQSPQAGQYRTMHEAFLDVANNYDLQGSTHRLILHLSDGDHASLRTYANLVGGNMVEIRGTTVPGQRSRIRQIGGACILVDQPGLQIFLRDVTLAGGIYAFYGGRIRTRGGIVFEETADDHISATYEGIISIDQNYTVTGGARTHIHAYSRGSIVVQDGTVVDVAPNLTFTNFIGVADASLVARGITATRAFQVRPFGASILVHKLGFADLGKFSIIGTRGPVVRTGGIVTKEDNPTTRESQLAFPSVQTGSVSVDRPGLQHVTFPTPFSRMPTVVLTECQHRWDRACALESVSLDGFVINTGTKSLFRVDWMAAVGDG